MGGLFLQFVIISRNFCRKVIFSHALLFDELKKPCMHSKVNSVIISIFASLILLHTFVYAWFICIYTSIYICTYCVVHLLSTKFTLERLQWSTKQQHANYCENEQIHRQMRPLLPESNTVRSSKLIVTYASPTHVADIMKTTHYNAGCIDPLLTSRKVLTYHVSVRSGHVWLANQQTGSNFYVCKWVLVNEEHTPIRLLKTDKKIIQLLSFEHLNFGVKTPLFSQQLHMNSQQHYVYLCMFVSTYSHQQCPIDEQPFIQPSVHPFVRRLYEWVSVLQGIHGQTAHLCSAVANRTGKKPFIISIQFFPFF